MNNELQLKIEKTIGFLADHTPKTNRLEFLSSLVKYLSELFDADYVLVDQYDKNHSDHASTIAVYNRDKYLPNFTYLLEETPCDNVIGKKFCCYQDKVQTQFPNDAGLKKMQVNSYAAIPLWNSEGEPIGLIAILDAKKIEDVKTYELILKLVSLKAADEIEKYNFNNQLEEQLKLFQSMFESSPDGVLITNANGDIRMFNKSFKKIFGYKKEEIDGENVSKLFSDSDTARKAIDAFTNAKDTKSEIKTYLLKNKEGDEFFGEVFYAKIFDKEGNWTDNIALFRDVTQEVYNRQKLNEALQNLEQSEKRYRELIGFAPDAFFQGKIDGTIIGLNNKSISLTGYSKDELMKMNISDFFKDKVLNYKPLRYDLLTEGQTIIAERKMTCKDGSERYIEMNSKLLPSGLPVSFFRDITSRKIAEMALRESEEKYKAVFNNAPLGIFHLNEKGIITDFNNEFVKILGSKRELLLGLNILTGIKDEKLMAEVKKTLTSGNGYYEDTYVSITSGKATPTIVYLNALRNEHGAITGGVGIVQDITLRKEHELKLKASNERILKQNKILSDVSMLKYVRTGEVDKLAKEINVSIAKAFNINRVGVWLLDETEKILRCLSLYELNKDLFSSGDKLMEEQFKSEFEYFRNEKYIDANDTLIDQRTAGYIEKYFKPMRISSLLDAVIRIRGKNIGVLCLEYVNEKHSWQPDEIAFVCQLADQIGMTIQNSEFRKTEEELIKLSRAVEQSPSSILITNLNGEIEYINQKFIELTGYSQKEVIGKTTNILKSGKTPKSVYDDLWNTITNGNSWTGELLNKKKNGELFWESILISPIVNSLGERKFYLAVKEDITEKKKMIGELIVAKEKAEESNRMKSAFLSTMSHELRTPLNAIIGLSELLRSTQNIDKIIRYSKTITESGYQLLSVVNDVMDISLIEAGESKVRMQPTPLVRLLSEVFEMFKSEQRRMRKQNISFKLLLPPDIHELVIITDQNKLKQILINLLKNAFKFADKGHVYVGFELVYIGDKQVVRFYVEDTGIGISKENYNLIFESFRQVEESHTRNYGGAGIGLSVSKKTTELLGGKIWVESEIGQGATFFFTLPYLTEKEFQ